MLRLDEKLTEIERIFIRILDNLGLSVEEIMGVIAIIKTEEQMDKIVDRLEEKQFKVTTQEAMNIIAQVIKENQ